MPGQLPQLQRIAIAAHPQIPEAIGEACRIADFIKTIVPHVIYGSISDDALRQDVQNGNYDMLIALGGDGTMLRAGHLCGPSGVPILGINMGRFGFLMEIQENRWQEILPRILDGDYWIEHRMMLSTTRFRDGEQLGQWIVVNEAVVSRGNYVRPVHLVTSVDGRLLTTYVADGLIASTPTGSTAYALAVGGPILPPELRTILLVPIAPHLSIDRAILLAEGTSVSIVVHTSHQAVLSIDGQAPIELVDGDCVEVHASQHTLKFIHHQDPGYFYRNLTPHMNQNPSTGNSR
jgi:NAD+ kinase